jgi:hypothetical protein
LVILSGQGNWTSGHLVKIKLIEHFCDGQFLQLVRQAAPHGKQSKESLWSDTEFAVGRDPGIAVSLGKSMAIFTEYQWQVPPVLSREIK